MVKILGKVCLKWLRWHRFAAPSSCIHYEWIAITNGWPLRAGAITNGGAPFLATGPVVACVRFCDLRACLSRPSRMFPTKLATGEVAITNGPGTWEMTLKRLDSATFGTEARIAWKWPLGGSISATFETQARNSWKWAPGGSLSLVYVVLLVSLRFAASRPV